MWETQQHQTKIGGRPTMKMVPQRYPKASRTAGWRRRRPAAPGPVRPHRGSRQPGHSRPYREPRRPCQGQAVRQASGTWRDREADAGLHRCRLSEPDQRGRTACRTQQPEDDHLREHDRVYRPRFDGPGTHEPGNQRGTTEDHRFPRGAPGPGLAPRPRAGGPARAPRPRPPSLPVCRPGARHHHPRRGRRP